RWSWKSPVTMCPEIIVKPVEPAGIVAMVPTVIGEERVPVTPPVEVPRIVAYAAVKRVEVIAKIVVAVRRAYEERGEQVPGGKIKREMRSIRPARRRPQWLIEVNRRKGQAPPG